ncbi:MAG: NADH-quinone oxidoreductase subunit NuoN [Alphaproteobacteria bacterium]|nr:NADH-quinone oxidoreductase subunit NuoN [Alphaproteobacteria bacterium]HRI76315.1 NADH-quinone oxidoreductase subunit NuoN [Alphaproteobacteria bacterium]
MRPFEAPALTPAFPEIFLGLVTLFLIILGVARKDEDNTTVTNFSIFALIAVAAVMFRFSHETFSTFNGMFVTDGFAVYMKILILLGSAVTIFMSARYVENQRMARFEYPVLILFSTLGMMLMTSANDLISLYMALELQSLPLYVLAAMRRDSVKSTEAGLKYFVLGALSSGMLLYGSSLIYGYTGATNFNDIAAALTTHEFLPVGVVTGMVLLLSGFAFKVAAVPFHMWTPDVYEGAPTSVTAFFAIVPKMASLALMVRVFMGPFEPMVDEWRQVVVLLAVASMALGGIAAIAQQNIKRMLAYSSIGHMGYALGGIAAASEPGIKAVIIYVTIYMMTSIGTFAIVLMMKQKDRMVENIRDLSGLASRQPMIALSMAIMMFSMAGIPPLAGFFSKLFIFQAAIDAGLYGLVFMGVITSVISAFYYLRIVKIMYFDAAPDEGIDPATDGRLNAVLAVSSVAVVLFIVIPVPILGAAGTAAATLFSR